MDERGALPRTGAYTTPPDADIKYYLSVEAKGDTVIKNHSSFYCTVNDQGRWCVTDFVGEAVIFLRRGTMVMLL